MTSVDRYVALVLQVQDLREPVCSNGYHVDRRGALHPPRTQGDLASNGRFQRSARFLHLPSVYSPAKHAQHHPKALRLLDAGPLLLQGHPARAGPVVEEDHLVVGAGQQQLQDDRSPAAERSPALGRPRGQR
ncbi:hypothetical protein FJT64_026771 [Amphibalanus amphitrite]|uniref:Uncharacterized protein n=1 Tax=Amphibalanus amphitrite TaxID=1232801 RepID=A0A6A4W308_AMPAM|nr:hypothetical protein FJT64_026771 [Amphibalanus amphitrite]